MTYVMKRSRREVDFFLVQRAICGDQAAYSEIYNNYSRFVRNAVSSILIRVPQDVDDVCMETFEKAFQSLHKFRPDYQLSAWLVRIAVNSAKDCLRRHGRVQLVSLDVDDTADDAGVVPLAACIATDDPLPTTCVENAQDIEYLEGLMCQLPVSEATMLRQKCLDGMSSDEIADFMGVSRKAVRRCVRNGLKHLQGIVSINDIRLRSR